MSSPQAFYLLVEYTLPVTLIDQYKLAQASTQYQTLQDELNAVPGRLKAFARNKISFEFRRTGVKLSLKDAVTLTINNPNGSITYRVGLYLPYDHPIFNFPEYDDRGSNANFPS